MAAQASESGAGCKAGCLRSTGRGSLFSRRNQGAMSSQGALEMPGLVGGIVGRGSEPSGRL